MKRFSTTSSSSRSNKRQKAFDYGVLKYRDIWIVLIRFLPSYMIYSTLACLNSTMRTFIKETYPQVVQKKRVKILYEACYHGNEDLIQWYIDKKETILRVGHFRKLMEGNHLNLFKKFYPIIHCWSIDPFFFEILKKSDRYPFIRFFLMEGIENHDIVLPSVKFLNKAIPWIIKEADLEVLKGLIENDLLDIHLMFNYLWESKNKEFITLCIQALRTFYTIPFKATPLIQYQIILITFFNQCVRLDNQVATEAILPFYRKLKDHYWCFNGRMTIEMGLWMVKHKLPFNVSMVYHLSIAQSNSDAEEIFYQYMLTHK
jgi:hypothetical protein